jgi:hypothetical protein
MEYLSIQFNYVTIEGNVIGEVWTPHLFGPNTKP